MPRKNTRKNRSKQRGGFSFFGLRFWGTPTPTNVNGQTPEQPLDAKDTASAPDAVPAPVEAITPVPVEANAPAPGQVAAPGQGGRKRRSKRHTSTRKNKKSQKKH